MRETSSEEDPRGRLVRRLLNILSDVLEHESGYKYDKKTEPMFSRSRMISCYSASVFLSALVLLLNFMDVSAAATGPQGNVKSCEMHFEVDKNDRESLVLRKMITERHKKSKKQTPEKSHNCLLKFIVPESAVIKGRFFTLMSFYEDSIEKNRYDWFHGDHLKPRWSLFSWASLAKGTVLFSINKQLKDDEVYQLTMITLPNGPEVKFKAPLAFNTKSLMVGTTYDQLPENRFKQLLEDAHKVNPTVSSTSCSKVAPVSEFYDEPSTSGISSYSKMAPVSEFYDEPSTSGISSYSKMAPVYKAYDRPSTSGTSGMKYSLSEDEEIPSLASSSGNEMAVSMSSFTSSITKPSKNAQKLFFYKSAGLASQDVAHDDSSKQDESTDTENSESSVSHGKTFKGTHHQEASTSSTIADCPELFCSVVTDVMNHRNISIPQSAGVSSQYSTRQAKPLTTAPLADIDELTSTNDAE